MLLVIFLLFLHAKQLLMKLFFGSLYHYSRGQPTPWSFYWLSFLIQRRVDSHFEKTRPVPLKIWYCLVFNKQYQAAKPETFLQQAHKKIDCLSVDGFCSHCNTVFEAMGCPYQLCPCQEVRPSLAVEVLQCGSKKRELDEVRRSYLQEKVFTVIEMWECAWWRLYKTSKIVMNVS